MISPGYHAGDIEKVFFDIILLFRGKFPGYKTSNTKYHDLDHTNAVMLAVVRLMHGCSLSGMKFSPKSIFLGVTAALFHDAGLIPAEKERDASEAADTIRHERRSIDFMKRYFSDRNYGTQDIEDCSHLIMCSIFNLPLKEIPFRSRKIETLGKIIGSAELLAQMADKYYCEKLSLLYHEGDESGHTDYPPESDLKREPSEFYRKTVNKRLQDDFSNVSQHMIKHFSHRWKIDKDLYADAIEKNIACRIAPGA